MGFCFGFLFEKAADIYSSFFSTVYVYTENRAKKTATSVCLLQMENGKRKLQTSACLLQTETETGSLFSLVGIG